MRIKRLEGKIYLVLKRVERGILWLAITCPEYLREEKIYGMVPHLMGVHRNRYNPCLLLTSAPYFSKVTEAGCKSSDIAYSEIHYRLFLPLHKFYE